MDLELNTDLLSAIGAKFSEFQMKLCTYHTPKLIEEIRQREIDGAFNNYNIISVISTRGQENNYMNI